MSIIDRLFGDIDNLVAGFLDVEGGEFVAPDGTTYGPGDSLGAGSSPWSGGSASLVSTSAGIEDAINNATTGDRVRIAPGEYTGVTSLAFGASDVTIVAYGAKIVADEGLNITRWPDFNGQDDIKVFGGHWDANPGGTDPRNEGEAAYGFANSNGTILRPVLKDVTVEGFRSMLIRPRNWKDGRLANCHAICDAGTTAYCPVLNTDSLFTDLSAEDVGDTYILADRNTNCSFIGGEAKASSVGSTHGIDSVSNVDCRFEGMTVDGNCAEAGADGMTDGVNIRDDAGAPNTGTVFDVTVRDVKSYGAFVRPPSTGSPAHEVVIDGYYTGMSVGFKSQATDAETVIRADFEDLDNQGIQGVSGTVIVDGATIRDPGAEGVTTGVAGSHIRDVHVTGAPGGTEPSLDLGPGVTVGSLSPPIVERATTDANGEVTFDFTPYLHSGDKPQIVVQTEGSEQWYIQSWDQDVNSRYQGCTIQVTDASGAAVGSGTSIQARVVGV